jgi:S-DNA-T family DNA segregation ATPase FtsK/SpoIIIE
VLFAGNDTIAGLAVALLEELARKGRSYGIHLILASQTIAGIEALFTKDESIFGQFPLRVALAGGAAVLDQLTDVTKDLPIGTAIVNQAAGADGAIRLVRFPNAEPAAVTAHRHRLWQARPPGDAPPAVFAGYAEHHIDDDPTFAALSAGVRRRQALVGRLVDVGLPTAGFTLDSSPGRHVAVLGTNPVAADVLHAATVGLSRQHAAGTATCLRAPLVASADDAADAAAGAVQAAGHVLELLNPAALRAHLGALTATIADADPRATSTSTYVVVFGADAASAVLAAPDPDTFRTGLDDLRELLRNGPAHGIHLLGWWRGLRRLSDDIGGSAGVEDLACLVALNVAGGDLGAFLGDYGLDWHPRPNRALIVDRHDDRIGLVVPFVRPGTLDRIEANR